jgi:hypothetical protein
VAEFAHLLRLELESLEMSEKHSRLYAHLPPIADVLMKWSTDSKSQSIWATLGFASATKVDARFKAFSCIAGTFITMRLVSGDKREQLVASMKQRLEQPEYQDLDTEQFYPMVERDGMQDLFKLLQGMASRWYPQVLLYRHDQDFRHVSGGLERS